LPSLDVALRRHDLSTDHRGRDAEFEARIVTCFAFILAAAFAVSASRGQGVRTDVQTKRIRIVTVVKRTGIVWFERMQEGITQFAAQNGVDFTGVVHGR